MHMARLALAIDLGDVGAETPLPTEFELFPAGVSESWKGPALFDEEAATLVMAAAEKWGVDLAIDLEHRSIDPKACALTNDATDALGWFRLAVKDDGSLWAVNVRWTADGEERLRLKKQRYVSPYFGVDKKTTRVLHVLNCALTSMPATFGAEALVAASVGLQPAPVPNEPKEPASADRTEVRRNTAMDPKLIADALEALIAGDEAKCAEILKGLVVSAAGGDPGSAEPEPAAEGAPDAPPLPEALTQAASVLASLTRAACELTGKDSVGEAVTALRSVFADREAAAAKENERAAALDLSSRRELIASLVSIGAETPATAWSRRRADGSECTADDRVPCARLLGEPLAELRTRADALRVARGGDTPVQTRQPPEGTYADGLTKLETETMNGLPEGNRAEYKALRLSRRAQ